MTTKVTRLTIDVSEDFRNELKIQAIAQGKTLREYVIEAVTEKIQRESALEDEVLGQMSKEAKKAGFIGLEASEALLNSMKECSK